MNKKNKDLKIFEDSNKINCRSFLKWVGGKSQLLPELHKRLPNSFNNYFEPFVGGGALLFSLQPEKAHISDLNLELINCYEVIRDCVDELILDLRQHRYDQEYYYQLRNADRLDSFEQWSPIQKASRMIFLNKSCFNGLYRLNSKSQFNVPFGRYTNPTIVDENNLKACSQFLSGTSIKKASFLNIESDIAKGDFVYFDPPYVPLNDTSNFTRYTPSGFGMDMQYELLETCRRLHDRGIMFMLSNSSAPTVLNLYQDFEIELVLAKRMINSKAQCRGTINEVIIRNF